MHLFHEITHFVLNLIRHLGYLGLFSGMLGQSVGVPLPSEVMLSFGGYLASLHEYALAGIIAVGAAGDTLGALVAYSIGYYGGRPFIERFGRIFFVRSSELQKADVWFDRFGTKAVFICKLLPGIRAFASYPAGVTRMSLPLFLGYTAAACLIWATSFAIIGFVLGRNWDRIASLLRPISALLLALLVVAIVFWIWSHFRTEPRTARHQ